MRWFGIFVLCLVLIGWMGACGTTSQPEGEPQEGRSEASQEPSTDSSLEPVTQEPGRDSNGEPSLEPPDAPEPLTEPPKEQTAEPTDASEPIPEGQRRDGDGPCGCASWQLCEEGQCRSKPCQKSEDCGDSATCVGGVCRSTLECCEVGTSRCSQRREESCAADAQGCGKWSAPTVCESGTNCHRGSCQPCRHRECANDSECCNGTTCSFGYCLVLCDSTKGDLNNPDCQSKEFCFPLMTGSPAVCIPDGNQQKGDPCSIVKPCGPGFSCVNVQNKGFMCYTDCKPSEGTAGNPSCTVQEQCGQVAGAAQGGICVPLTGTAKKLHEECDQSNPCIAPNLCTGEPGSGKTYCLAPCDPTASTSSCPASDECVAYNASTPTKGVCLQKCSNPGTVDNCTYGQCRAKGQEKLCL